MENHAKMVDGGEWWRLKCSMIYDTCKKYWGGDIVIYSNYGIPPFLCLEWGTPTSRELWILNTAGIPYTNVSAPPCEVRQISYEQTVVTSQRRHSATLRWMYADQYWTTRDLLLDETQPYMSTASKEKRAKDISKGISYLKDSKLSLLPYIRHWLNGLPPRDFQVYQSVRPFQDVVHTIPGFCTFGARSCCCCKYHISFNYWVWRARRLC